MDETMLANDLVVSELSQFGTFKRSKISPFETFSFRFHAVGECFTWAKIHQSK